MARHTRELTGARNLVLAGGVALNCVANGKLLREQHLRRHLDSAGRGRRGRRARRGAARRRTRYFDVPRRLNPGGRDTQQGSLLGPAISAPHEVRAFLDRHGYPASTVPTRRSAPRASPSRWPTARSSGTCIGRMEFGPRALGARSILGDPRRTDMQSVMNLKIKYRESFRPFAPAVLRRARRRVLRAGLREPVHAAGRAGARGAAHAPTDMAVSSAATTTCSRSSTRRAPTFPPSRTSTTAPASRPSTPDDNPEFHRCIAAFERLTGCGVLVNTSFNVRGEPIVCTPQDAYRCFMRTEIDLLVLEDCILHKAAQPPFKDDDDWRKEYELD